MAVLPFAGSAAFIVPAWIGLYTRSKVPTQRQKSIEREKPLSAQAAKQRHLRGLICGDEYECEARSMGAKAIAGVDEVGRGCLFGPVVAAAVILPEKVELPGLRDSKQLKQAERERLDAEIRRVAVTIAIGHADAATIDAINIRRATHRAMLLAIAQLVPGPDFLLIDAERLDTPCMQRGIVYGDSVSISIAAASVIAKVYRDAWMQAYDREYPQYGLASHKGYGTVAHLRALQEHGPTPLHRMTFAPVRECAQRG